MKIIKSKKAYMRTIEAAIAVLISFLFITFIVFSNQASEKTKTDLDLFSILEENPEFRNCVLIENYSCLNTTIALHYPDFVKVNDIRINITTDPNIVPLDLPDKEVNLETLFIAGNNTYSSPRIMRLYYWIKD